MVNRIQRNALHEDLPDWDREGIVLSDRMPLRRGVLFSRITQQIRDDETILVAVSGGSDSMALLLLSLPPEQQRERLVVGHIHHGTGEFADQAASLLERVCGELNVRLIVERIEIDEARRKELGFEAAARGQRYAALERIANRCNAGLQLSGHTRDDLAETFLINAMRGAGLTGLAGLKPERGKWRRPLLRRTHEELRHFLEEESFPFIDDPANEDEVYTRVAVRRQLGKLIREKFGEGHWANIARSAQHLHGADQALEIEAFRLANSVIRRRTPGWVSIDAGELGGYLSELVIRVLRRILSWVRGCPIEDIYLDRKDRRHLLDMVHKPKTGQTIRVDGIRVTDRGELEFSVFSSDTRIHIKPPGECSLPDGSRVRVDAESVNPSAEVSVQGSGCPGFIERLDADVVGPSCTIRPWQVADRFIPLGSDGELKRVTRRLRRPSAERIGPLWVMEVEDGRIAWVLGERISEPFKVTERTRSILIFRYYPLTEVSEG